MCIFRAALAIQLALLVFEPVPGFADEHGDATTADLNELDLSGAWYVLIHYRDDRSQDASIARFKDFAWSIRQAPTQLVWESYPFVLFDDDTELLRRHAMTEHLAWEPNKKLRARIRESIQVSPRGMTKKRLRGSFEQGFKSEAPSGAGGLNTLTFSRHWNVSFEKPRVRIEIVDSLSGTQGLEGMEESTVFEINERVGSDELRGRWREAHKQGSFRMLRARERRVVK